MSKSERLTERVGDGVRYDNGEYIITCYPKNNNLTTVDKLAAKLCDLEDKIENKTLFELPCKVGDTVYIIDNRDMLYIDPSVCSVVDDEIYEMGYGRTQSGELKWLFLVLETGEYFYDDDVGKTVFLAREDAERALEERIKA